jgi:hypothetical protein
MQRAIYLLQGSKVLLVTLVENKSIVEAVENPEAGAANAGFYCSPVWT